MSGGTQTEACLEASRAPRRSHDLCRVLLENSRDLMLVHDLGDGSLHVSPALEALLGRDARELRALGIAGLVHPDDVPLVVSAVGQLLRRERALVAQARLQDRWGRWIELEGLGTPVVDESGAPTILLVIVRDITGSRRSFEALAESERSYRLLMEQASDAIVIADAHGTVRSVNRRACVLLGYERRELAGTNLRDLIAAEHSLELDVGQLLAGASSFLVELHLRRKDGELVPVEVSATRLEDERLLAIVRDLRERQRREAAEREFVVNAAHDLRTPLAGIAAALEILESGAKEVPEDRDRFLEDIGRETARLGRLVRALLLLALVQTYQEALQLGPVRLGPLLHDVARGVPSGTIDVVVDCPADLAALSDPDLLERIVSNLLANAVANTEEGRILSSARGLADGRVEIEVADTGSGITPEDQEHVFDRFYRAVERDGEGFGLGLSIVHETVRALRGTLELESAAGVGTTVRVAIPGSPQDEAR